MLDSNPVTTLIVAIITVQSASDRVTSLSQSDAWIFKKTDSQNKGTGIGL
jgi:hypothetical protein